MRIFPFKNALKLPLGQNFNLKRHEKLTAKRDNNTEKNSFFCIAPYKKKREKPS